MHKVKFIAGEAQWRPSKCGAHIITQTLLFVVPSCSLSRENKTATNLPLSWGFSSPFISPGINAVYKEPNYYFIYDNRSRFYRSLTYIRTCSSNNVKCSILIYCIKYLQKCYLHKYVQIQSLYIVPIVIIAINFAISMFLQIYIFATKKSQI